MERFVSQQNIERYRKLLDRSTDAAQRRMIFKLLEVAYGSPQICYRSSQPWKRSFFFA
jgi:hypothetical protein